MAVTCPRVVGAEQARKPGLLTLCPVLLLQKILVFREIIPVKGAPYSFLIGAPQAPPFPAAPFRVPDFSNPHIHCVALDKLLSLSEPHPPYLPNGDITVAHWKDDGDGEDSTLCLAYREPSEHVSNGSDRVHRHHRPPRLRGTDPPPPRRPYPCVLAVALGPHLALPHGGLTSAHWVNGFPGHPCLPPPPPHPGVGSAPRGSS